MTTMLHLGVALAVTSAGCSGLAIERGGSSARHLDEIGTSLGASHGSIGGRSGGGIAGEILAQDTFLSAGGGFGLRGGLMYDTTSLPAENNAPKQNGTYYGWYAMPIAYVALVPNRVYARAGLGWIFSGHVKAEGGGMNLSEGAMGARAMLGLHIPLISNSSFSYRFFLDGMATTTQDTSIGSYSGVALVGGFLVGFNPGNN